MPHSRGTTTLFDWWPWGKIKISRNIYKPPPFFTKSEADWLWNGDANSWLWKRKEPEVMGVKVEKIEPKPQPLPDVSYCVTGVECGQPRDYDGNPHAVRWNEKTARAIYEGLAEHFAASTTGPSWSAHKAILKRMSDQVAEQHAEIARLDQHVAQLRVDKDAEIARLKAAYDRVIEDNDRLRGWLEIL